MIFKDMLSKRNDIIYIVLYFYMKEVFRDKINVL